MTLVRINGDLLRERITEKGISMAEASVQLGYSNSYIRNAVKSGTIRGGVLDMINHLYGIETDDLVFKKQPEEVKKLEDLGIDLTPIAISEQADAIFKSVASIELMMQEDEERNQKQGKTFNYTCSAIQEAMADLIDKQERMIQLLSVVADKVTDISKGIR